MLWYNLTSAKPDTTSTASSSTTTPLNACYRDGKDGIDLTCPHKAQTKQHHIKNLYGRAAFHMFNSIITGHKVLKPLVYKGPSELFKDKVFSDMYRRGLGDEIVNTLLTPGGVVKLPNMPRAVQAS